MQMQGKTLISQRVPEERVNAWLDERTPTQRQKIETLTARAVMKAGYMECRAQGSAWRKTQCQLIAQIISRDDDVDIISLTET